MAAMLIKLACIILGCVVVAGPIMMTARADWVPNDYRSAFHYGCKKYVEDGQDGGLLWHLYSLDRQQRRKLLHKALNIINCYYYYHYSKQVQAIEDAARDRRSILRSSMRESAKNKSLAYM
ncbi:hypothetical protein AKJ16_DCAP15154 [Drosera capensis]